ncbi:DUF1015 family protein [Actinokineospora sp. HUAS TT18]|uniref:DUF1015 family protein n=1 Tax=Actinokineospora sp. HUAS TT18 TaxID=3447451 RepID=UPI003F5219BA
MTGWVRPIKRGWVVRSEVPGPDVDEFAEQHRVTAALAQPGAARGTLLAVQHPHRTPPALADGLTLLEALPHARRALQDLVVSAYRSVEDVVAPYQVDGPDGSAIGLLCMVDPAAVGGDGTSRVVHTEQVYPDVVAERAAVLAGLGCATSAALLVPVTGGDQLTAAVTAAIAASGAPAVSTVDAAGRRHRVWLLGPGPIRDAIMGVAAAQALLVADGNHRVAAAAAAKLDGILALVTAGPLLRIGAFHRVLVGTGLSLDAMVDAWRACGLVVRAAPDAPAPTVPGTVVVRHSGRSVVVELPPVDPAETLPRIDHAVVEDLMVHKALGVDPEGPCVRTLPNGRDPGADAEAVILIAPVPLDDVLAVHAAGERMPRKSTYFTPKPRSGLLLADLN